MKRTKRWMIPTILVLVLVGGVAWYAFRAKPTTTGPVTAPVARRDLVATVAATGTIRAVVGGEVKVGSRVAGRVTQLAVQVGDRVAAGQVIAVLEHDDLRAALDRTRAELAAAEARAAQAAADLTSVRQIVELNIARETARVSAARARLRLIEQGARPEEIAQAESAVRQAEANYGLAKATADRVQALFQGGLVARREVDLAQRDLAVAASQVQGAQEQLGLIKTRYRPEDIAIARDEVHQAEIGLVLARADADRIAARQRDLEVAQAQARAARSAVKISETNLAYATITTPISGIVASVSTQQGETVTSGSAAASAPTFVTVIDLSRLEVHAFVDETDIGKVRVGQDATFTVDAFPDREFSGKVTAIYPKAVIAANVVTYDVVIALENPGGILRPDMTANVMIVAAKREQVLAIPNQAVRREGADRVGYVLEGGQVVRRVIKIGWKDKTYTEVLSGLKQGERVIVGAAEGTGVSRGEQK